MLSGGVPAPSEPAEFSILCVCTGNICRSPAAERLLTDRLGPSIRVRSAGTHPIIDAPISPEMVSLISAAGHRVTASAARRLTAGEITTTDLVLTMTRAHRSAVVELVPAAVRRTFTLREFARLVRTLEHAAIPGAELAARLHAMVPVAARQRSEPVDSDDIIDPYRQSNEVYRQAFDAIDQAVTLICTALLPDAGQPEIAENKITRPKTAP